jgi:hypothetical protein
LICTIAHRNICVCIFAITDAVTKLHTN